MSDTTYQIYLSLPTGDTPLMVFGDMRVTFSPDTDDCRVWEGTRKEAERILDFYPATAPIYVTEVCVIGGAV